MNVRLVCIGRELCEIHWRLCAVYGQVNVMAGWNM